MALKHQSYNFYEYGSAARKREYEYVEETKKEEKNTKLYNKVSAKKRTSTIFTILCVFSMTMIIVYRFGVINEKNLYVQELKDNIVTTESAIATAKINVEQNTDLNKIETYAKQQLGMQKPDKNQIIYIDSSDTNTSVKLQENKSFFSNLIDNIKNGINKYFN